MGIYQNGRWGVQNLKDTKEVCVHMWLVRGHTGLLASVTTRAPEAPENWANLRWCMMGTWSSNRSKVYMKCFGDSEKELFLRSEVGDWELREDFGKGGLWVTVDGWDGGLESCGMGLGGDIPERGHDDYKGNKGSTENEWITGPHLARGWGMWGMLRGKTENAVAASW